MADEPKIVQAVMTSSSSFTADGKVRASLIQQAMSDEVIKCANEGITDSALIKERMLKARDELKKTWAVSQSEQK
jgi:hypothetical protein